MANASHFNKQWWFALLNKHRVFINIFLVYLAAATVCGVLLELTGLVARIELQTINRRFEARPWLKWEQQSLQRLNPATLLKYHDEHEIPRRWWAWDYTLSWLIENNHPVSRHHIVIFNHSLEDEPPAEAVGSHAWMKPLLQHPVSRATIADAIEFIAKAGARLIILDSDFPQYSTDDRALAAAIYNCATGKAGAKPVPVLMTASVTRKSYDNLLQLHAYSPPRGVIEELAKLDPSKDVVNEYTGSAGLLPDEDQVVRQLACFVPGRARELQESVVIKGLKKMGEPVPADLPAGMDIDFAGPPNSELYKIRPFWYLLDPDHRRMLAGNRTASGESTEPDLQDAIVILGDGVTDLHNTPYTNLGANLRSGSEILAQAMDTISRHSWPRRPATSDCVMYLLATIVLGAAFLASVKGFSSPHHKVSVGYTARILIDLTVVAAGLAISWLVACEIFAVSGIIVPFVVPAASLVCGSLAAAVWQAQFEKMEALTHELKDAKTHLALIHGKHEAELREQAAVARADAIQQDRERRREFGRRLNHDLKAPLSILNWTLAKMRSDGLTAANAEDKLERLFKTANRLFNLIGELSRTYDYEVAQGDTQESACNVREVIADSVTLHRAVADMMGSKVEMQLPPEDSFAAVGVFQLTRVIDNLIGNALVHNPPGTTVSVKLEPENQRHAILISDDGVGIPVESLGERMIRGTERGNSGLGLSIVHQLVRDMEGELTIKSSSDRGTIITVNIPASGEPRPVEAQQEPTVTMTDTDSNACMSKGAR